MKRRYRLVLWVITGSVSLVIGWNLLSGFVAPAAIEAVYHARLPYLDNLTLDRAHHPVEEYLAQWDVMRRTISTFLILIVIFVVPLFIGLTTSWPRRDGADLKHRPMGKLTSLSTNGILTIILLGVIVSLYYLCPVGYVYFITEDYWAEYGTSVSFGIAFCLLVWALWSRHYLRRPGIFLLALFSFFFAMEEISWGQRILGFGTPQLLADQNLQKEANVHNLINVPEYTIIGVIVLLWSIAVPLLARKSSRFRRWCELLGVPIISSHLWPFFGIVIYFTLASPILKSDEVSELLLGIAVAALAVDLAVSREKDAPGREAAVSMATIGVMAHLTIITSYLVFNYPGSPKQRLNEFAATRFPLNNMNRQAAMIFDYIHRNPHLSTPETSMHYGKLLMEMDSTAKAVEFLELALQEQRQLQQKNPNDPTPNRNLGTVLSMLMRPEEAKRAFREALETDLAELKRAADDEARARAFTSMGKTLLAMGDREMAREYFSKARMLTSDRRTSFQLNKLMQKISP